MPGATHHHVSVAALHHPEGVPDRVHASGAGCGHGMVGAQQLVPARSSSSLGCMKLARSALHASLLLDAAKAPGVVTTHIPRGPAKHTNALQVATRKPTQDRAHCLASSPDGHSTCCHVVEDARDEVGGHLAKLAVQLYTGGDIIAEQPLRCMLADVAVLVCPAAADPISEHSRLATFPDDAVHESCRMRTAAVPATTLLAPETYDLTACVRDLSWAAHACANGHPRAQPLVLCLWIPLGVCQSL